MAKQSLALPLSLSLPLLFLLLLGLGSGLSPGLAAQVEPATITPTWTAVPTFTPTPTLSALVTDLKHELIFPLGGAGGSGVDCLPSPNPSRLPAVAYQRVFEDRLVDLVCLYGFKLGDKLTVKLYDPAGRLAASIPLIILKETVSVRDFSINTLALPPLAYAAPAGPWSIRVEGGATPAAVTVWNPPPRRDFSLSRSVNPGTGWFDVQRMPRFVQGDTLLISGVRFDKSAVIPVAIYRREDKLQLAAIQMVATNRLGRFNAGFLINSQYKPGRYYAVVDPDPGLNSMAQANVKSWFEVLQPVGVCPDGLPSLLAVDQPAMVTPGPPIQLYEDTSLSSRVIGTIAEYETVDVTSGPWCAGGQVWWKVLSRNTGLGGYTLEGREGAYWLRQL